MSEVMTIAALVVIVQKVSVVLTVFTFGLQLNPLDLTYFFQRPRLLLRSLLSMSVAMPLVAVFLAASFDLYPDVKVALAALSLSPIPPRLPKKLLKAGGDSTYAFSLLVTAATLAIVLVPVGVRLFESLFGISSQMPPASVADIMLVDVLAPLAAGMLVPLIVPALADRIAKPVSSIALGLLALSMIFILFTAVPAILSLLGNGTFTAIVMFVVAGLAIGHLLGGPNPEDQTVLALSTASRHPGVALAIAVASAPAQTLVSAAVALHVIVSGLLSMLYLAWRRRR